MPIANELRLKDEQVFVGVGSDDVLAMSFLTFFNSQKPVLFPDITYSFYDVWADLFRIPYERPALDENFHIRKEDYSEKTEELYSRIRMRRQVWRCRWRKWRILSAIILM